MAMWNNQRIHFIRVFHKKNNMFDDPGGYPTYLLNMFLRVTGSGESSGQMGGSEMDWNMVASGKLTVCYWKWPFIVDFPIQNVDFP